MDELELKYLIALQPQIQEAMGEWQIGDLGYTDELGNGILHGNGLMYFGKAAINPDWLKNIVRIPAALPLPGQDAGRTLVGMIDGLESITFFKTSAVEVYRVRVQ